MSTTIINIDQDIEDTYFNNEQEWMCKIVDAGHKNQKVIISFNEGPALEEINYKGKKFLSILKELCESNGWPLDKFEFRSMNLIQNKTHWPLISYIPIAGHFLSCQKKPAPYSKTFDKIFGMFIGRSSWDRLYIASHLYNKHRNKSLQTFRNYLDHPGSMLNLDLDRFFWLTSSYNNLNQLTIDKIYDLIKDLPLTINDSHKNVTHIQWNNGAVDNEILGWYNKIFIDVICEKMITGETFFPTEKTARCLATKTPFLIMGPSNYIQNLKKLGFKSFDKFWDESYDYQSGVQRAESICKIIDHLANIDNKTLKDMHDKMYPILENNFQIYNDLTQDKIRKIFIT